MTGDRFRSPRPEDLDAAARHLYDTITSGPRASGDQPFPLAAPDGSLHGPFGPMLLQPGVGSALQDLGAAIRYRGHLSDREREIAILAVAAATGSAFEAWAHERVAATIGMEPDELAAIAGGTFAGVGERERWCGEVPGRLVRERALSDAEFAAAAAALGEADLLELVVLVGYYSTLALVMDVFGVGPPDDSPATDH